MSDVVRFGWVGVWWSSERMRSVPAWTRQRPPASPGPCGVSGGQGKPQQSQGPGRATWLFSAAARPAPWCPPKRGRRRTSPWPRAARALRPRRRHLRTMAVACEACANAFTIIDEHGTMHYRLLPALFGAAATLFAGRRSHSVSAGKECIGFACNAARHT